MVDCVCINKKIFYVDVAKNPTSFKRDHRTLIEVDLNLTLFCLQKSRKV